MQSVVQGEANGAKRDVILANAGAAIYVAGEDTSIVDGVEAADKAIVGGDAAAKLADLQTAIAT
jgi:anthranilate phosphoribosyltransferase